MNAGVYQIVAPSGRRYIGSTVNFARRWQQHRARMRCGQHGNRLLQAAWNKYGEALRFEVVLICAPAQVVFYEQIAINALAPEMNVAPAAGSTLGYRHTEETKAKFKTRRKRAYTPEQIAAQAAKVRRPMTPEQRAAHAERMSRRDYTMSEATKEKLRAANLGKKYGPMSEEHRAKIGAANSGRKPSAAAAEARRGLKQRPETVEARISKVRGVTWTPERRAKFAATWAAKREAA